MACFVINNYYFQVHGHCGDLELVSSLKREFTSVKHLWFIFAWDFAAVFRVQIDEEDKDGQNVPFKAQEHASDSRQRPYRLWYTIEVQASAPPPERTF